ncbi:Nudix hydrolase 16, mitochondrial [Orobanche hederae]
MSELVARTGRHQQRYEDGYRLIAGCIPFRYRNVEEDGGDTLEKIVEVLMINSNSGSGLLFPKDSWIVQKQRGKIYCLLGGWENDETAEEAAGREAMEEAGVRGDLVHFLGCFSFKSKTLQDEYSPEGLCRAAMYALHVKEELDCWPEKSQRKRSWLTIPEAVKCCRHAWMQEALEKGFSKWCANGTNIMLP